MLSDVKIFAWNCNFPLGYEICYFQSLIISTFGGKFSRCPPEVSWFGPVLQLAAQDHWHRPGFNLFLIQPGISPSFFSKRNARVIFFFTSSLRWSCSLFVKKKTSTSVWIQVKDNAKLWLNPGLSLDWQCTHILFWCSCFFISTKTMSEWRFTQFYAQIFLMSTGKLCLFFYFL